MTGIAFVLFLGYLALLAFEKWSNDRCRRAIPHVIHVNGIRGKTGTSRLIDAGLRAAGLKVFTKTTGNLPRYIDTQGVEHPIRRHAPANIKEQIAMMRRAAKEGADVLILECMAVNPTYQKVCEEEILRSTVGVITNVRYDHVLEMGGSLEAIAKALSATIPRDGQLFTADAAFAPFFEEKAAARGSTLTCCCPPVGEANPLMENVVIAQAVCEAVTGTRPDADTLTRGERRDFGALAAYTIRNKAGEAVRFLNLFAVNDPTSALNALRANMGDAGAVIYLLNNRADRPDRAELFAERFFPGAPPGAIRVVGQARGLACRILRRRGHRDVTAHKDYMAALEAPAGTLIVGMCNIKGPGVAITGKMEANAL